MIILESNEVTRLGLKAALQTGKDIEVIGDYEDIGMMMTDMNSLNPDVVILGGTEDIIDRTRKCQEVMLLCPAAKVLTLTEKQKDSELQEFILAGASGNIPRDAGSAEMVRSVSVVSCGGLNFESEALIRLLEHVPRQPLDDRKSVLEALTERECLILALIAQGQSNTAIGQELNISKYTVRNNVAKIREKLNITSRYGLVAFAIINGITAD